MCMVLKKIPYISAVCCLISRGMDMKGKIFLIISFILCIFLCACQDEGEYVDSDKEENVKNEFVFIFHGNDINIGDKADNVLALLGEYKSSFVADSCAYQGRDTYYYYDGFEIMTSEINGQEILTDIFVTAGNIETVKGVEVGMEISKMAQAMGPADKSGTDNYTYFGEGVNLQINAKDNKVASIEYYYVKK